MAQGVVAIIPARYGSTRLPGKPLVSIAGRPLVQHVYERASLSGAFDRVLVATDDERVARRVREFGGEAVLTRGCHPSGTDRVAEVAEGLDAEIVVNVQGDLPFLGTEAFRVLLRTLREGDAPMATVRARLVDRTEWERPDVVKVVTDSRDYALYFSRSPIPYQNGATVRASRHVGLYAYRRAFLLELGRLEPTALELAEGLEQLRVLEHGYPIKVGQIDEVPVEVNTPEDLELARRSAERETRT
ncbi:MAG: 3-deoxy-manno-octulosonate cytidylyltransferase [Candidatus Binatia bacterium]|nr:MAG: 3-deoxy-manno-octulosonate cytidylyltransferase [Candidatus Binatia bacterium]